MLYLANLTPKELARIRKEDAKRMKIAKEERARVAKIIEKEKKDEIERLKAGQRDFRKEDAEKLALLKEDRMVLTRIAEEERERTERERKEREEELKRLRELNDPKKLKARMEAEDAQRAKALKKQEEEKKKVLLEEKKSAETVAASEKRDIEKEKEERLMHLRIEHEVARIEQESIAREAEEKRRKQEKEEKKLSANVVEARRIKSVLIDAKRVVETVKKDLVDVKKEINVERSKLKKINDKRERNQKLRELMLTQKSAENRVKLAYKIYDEARIKKVINKNLLTQLGVRPDLKVLSADFWRKVEAKERVELVKDRSWALESVSRTFKQLEDMSASMEKKVDIRKDGALHFWGDKEKKVSHDATKKITGKISEEDLAIGGMKLKRREDIDKGIDQSKLMLTEVDRAVDDTLRQIDRSRTLSALEADIARKEREEMLTRVKSTDLNYGVRDVEKYLAAKKGKDAKKEAEKDMAARERAKPKLQETQAARKPEYKRIDVRGGKEERKLTGSGGHFTLEKRPAKADGSLLRRMFGQPTAAKKGPPGQQAKVGYTSTEFDFDHKVSPVSKKVPQTTQDQYKYSTTEFDVSKIPPAERAGAAQPSSRIAKSIKEKTMGGVLVKKFAKKGVIPVEHTVLGMPRGAPIGMGTYQKTSVSALGWINKTALLSTVIGIIFAIGGLILYIADEFMSKSVYAMGVGSIFLCFGISMMIYSTNKSNWLMKTGFLAVSIGMFFTSMSIAFYLFQKSLFIVFLYLGAIGAIFIVAGICIESFGSKITIRLTSNN